MNKFPNSLKSFRTVWKVSGQSGKFLDSLENLQTVWKVSGQSGKFTDSLESFQTVWKVSRGMYAKATAGALTHKLVLFVFMARSCFHQISGRKTPLARRHCQPEFFARIYKIGHKMKPKHQLKSE